MVVVDDGEAHALTGPSAAPLGAGARLHAVTAWNPGGRPHPCDADAAAHQRLLAHLSETGVRWRAAVGVGREEVLRVIACDTAKVRAERDRRT